MASLIPRVRRLCICKVRAGLGCFRKWDTQIVNIPLQTSPVSFNKQLKVVAVVHHHSQQESTHYHTSKGFSH